ncbi:MAG: M20/M25/M40 family metallo-hydrolase [Acidobacteria bacterium]|nr:M20/M25/M40 family metallo-hydrolase [Acidobacteriota bacterium]
MTKTIERTPSPTTATGKSRLTGLAALLLVALAACLSVYRQSPPAAVAASAPPAEFASGRAMKYVQSIGQKPHPMGSQEHTVVRDYILRELSALGVEPEVQKTTVLSKRDVTPLVAGSVENIIATLKGTGNTKALLLAAHYDSVPSGPGASDDGSGVATLLETLRGLKAGTPLKNDVIFLFTDGEEIGLLGAEGFVDEHPVVGDVGLVLNFEARGTAGPSYMYETSEGNGWLIEEFAKVVPRPVTNSLLFEVYKLLPNATDLSIFKGAGLAGLNFAYIDQPTYYHTQLDNPRTIDERSLQHQGSYALALTRHFGSLDLRTNSKANAVYFDLLGAFVVRYPASLVVPLTILTVLLFIAVVVLGYKRRRLTFSGMMLGFVALLLAMIAAGLVVMLVWRLVSGVHSEYAAMTYGDTYNSKLYLVGFIALTLAITSGIYLLFGRRVSVLNLWVGAIIWWMLALILTTLLLPGASYLFTWTLLPGLLSLLLLMLSTREESPAWKRLAVFFVGAVPSVILFSPLILTLFIALNVTSSALVMVVVALLLGLIIPQVNLADGMYKWLLPSISLLLCVGFLIAASMTSKFDASHPRQDNVFYALDGDRGQAVWASTGSNTDEWTSQFFSTKMETIEMPAFFPGRPWKFLTNEAQVVSLAPPQIELRSDDRTEAGRTLRLNITSARQAPVLSLYVDAETEVRGTLLNGKPFKQETAGAKNTAGNSWALRYYALPAEGVELVLTSKSAQPVRITAVDQTYELPSIPGTPFKPRPAGVIPAPHPLSDSTLVSKSFTF